MVAVNFPDSPVDGEIFDIYQYDAASGTWNKLTYPFTIASLGDVAISNPVNDEVLVYNSLSSSWENATLPNFRVDSIKEETGATYTLSSNDANDIILFNSLSTVQVTIPDNLTDPIPLLSSIHIVQKGVGQVAVSGAAGVTVNNAIGLNTRTQWSKISVFKISDNEWVLSGDAV